MFVFVCVGDRHSTAVIIMATITAVTNRGASLPTIDSMSHALSWWHGLNLDTHSLNWIEMALYSTINSSCVLRQLRSMQLISNHHSPCWPLVLWSHSSSWQPSQSRLKGLFVRNGFYYVFTFEGITWAHGVTSPVAPNKSLQVETHLQAFWLFFFRCFINGFSVTVYYYYYVSSS